MAGRDAGAGMAGRDAGAGVADGLALGADVLAATDARLASVSAAVPDVAAVAAVPDLPDAAAEVLAAADAIIDNFSNHRRDAYFGGFAADATFLFHTLPERLESREAYELLWANWEAEGFAVKSCRSTARRVQLVGSAAVFSHDVATVLEMAGVEESLDERETIVFEKRDGAWLAVHEHLSARS